MPANKGLSWKGTWTVESNSTALCTMGASYSGLYHSVTPISGVWCDLGCRRPVFKVCTLYGYSGRKTFLCNGIAATVKYTHSFYAFCLDLFLMHYLIHYRSRGRVAHCVASSGIASMVEELLTLISTFPFLYIRHQCAGSKETPTYMRCCSIEMSLFGMKFLCSISISSRHSITPYEMWCKRLLPLVESLSYLEATFIRQHLLFSMDLEVK
jgi:hypothetical protein